MCFAYRSICIALANHRSDYAASERALKAAESFQASVTAKHRLAEDRTKLGNLLGAAAQRSAQQKVMAAQHSIQQKSSTRSGVGWLVALGIIAFFVLIGSFRSDKPSSSGSYSSAVSTPLPYSAPILSNTAPSTRTAPPTFTAPSKNGANDKGTYSVPSYVTSELDRDKEAIDNEKAKAAALERRLDSAKQAVNTEKAKAEEWENQLSGLDAQISRARTYLDRTSQFDVDELNRKVNRYNVMLSNVRAANERVNQVVDIHNTILEQARVQDRVVNRMIDDYNAKLQRVGR